MNPADAVMRWLDDQGHGTAGTDLFLDAMPATPDEAAMVVATGGVDVNGAVAGWTNPTVQLLVRGTTDPRTSAGRCQNLLDAVRDLSGQVDDSQGGTARVAGVVLAQAHPVRLGLDDEGRHRHSGNLTLLLDR